MQLYKLLNILYLFNCLIDVIGQNKLTTNKIYNRKYYICIIWYYVFSLLNNEI